MLGRIVLVFAALCVLGWGFSIGSRVMKKYDPEYRGKDRNR